jgi:NhaP-type Na+/H+ or K+/H+ antiporter
MAWDQLTIDKPHLAYMILGGFTSLFMLCSLFVKEKLYIGEATVATLCGIIFGPNAANLFDPGSWGNVDKLTLECSRIVLVVQCFAVGVELPKSYMERHWKSVSLLLIPVMTYGWLVTSLFIWWMVEPLTWLESLACAACVTATDPVLASSVVGKGKFAKRVPKHLRDLLSAESGCNDGMAFPFIYLAVYLIEYHPRADKVAFHWICFTILYECIFGAIFGFLIGYMGRHAIRYAEEKNLIDRESFLVFYFVLALFCAGSGSLLGMDDLLIGFSAGVGFSNDGWFTEKTEESHVSNVIDLLLNLAYFVYFGAIIPWEQFNKPDLGMLPWRLVVIAVFVIFFRRIPVMLLLKPIIPDVKTWREALFAGHFGPIGVGAIFAAILTRAELETGSAQPLADLPKPGSENYALIALIWPITTFMVISSILVHGSSIAVFTLGKHINTLTITMSYTQANEDGPSWMNRLPRIQSLSRTSMSFRKGDFSESSSNEKVPELPPGTLPPIGIAGNLLRRQREEEQSSEPNSRASSLRPGRRRMLGPGGPISQSAIMPQRRLEVVSPVGGDGNLGDESGQQLLLQVQEPVARSDDESQRNDPGRDSNLEIYQEGDTIMIEDQEGNVLKTGGIAINKPLETQREDIMEQGERLRDDASGEFAKCASQPHESADVEEPEKAVADAAASPYQRFKKQLIAWTAVGKGGQKESQDGLVDDRSKKQRTRQTARAYQFGHTIIVEDKDGEVIKQYTIPELDKEQNPDEEKLPGTAQLPNMRRRLSRMGTWVGFGDGKDSETSPSARNGAQVDGESSDDGVRFTVTRPVVGRKGTDQFARRMSKQDFIKEIQQIDPKAHSKILERPDSFEHAKNPFHRESRQKQPKRPDWPAPGTHSPGLHPRGGRVQDGDDERDHDIPTHDDGAASHHGDSDDDGSERIPPTHRRQAGFPFPPIAHASPHNKDLDFNSSETPAERKRRLAALGELNNNGTSSSAAAASGGGVGSCDNNPRDSDSEDDGQPRIVRGKVQFADGTMPAKVRREPVDEGAARGDGNGNANERGRNHRTQISWGGERGRDV